MFLVRKTFRKLFYIVNWKLWFLHISHNIVFMFGQCQTFSFALKIYVNNALKLVQWESAVILKTVMCFSYQGKGNGIHLRNTLLAAKCSAGVTPEVNLFCTDNEACKWENPPWIWNQGQKSKTAVSVLMYWCPPKSSLEKRMLLGIFLWGKYFCI